jgi:hypothetical protein
MKLWPPVQAEAPAEQRVQEQERVLSGAQMKVLIDLMMGCSGARPVAARLELARS